MKRLLGVVLRPVPLSFRMKQWLVRRQRRFAFILDFSRDCEVTIDYYAGDLTVRIDPRNMIECEMLSGRYDPCATRVIERYVNPGDCAIDIGANVGALTLLMARRVSCGGSGVCVGDGGCVLAFEPGPPIHARLERNIQLNPSIRDCVRLFPVGLSDMRGVLHWREDTGNRGNGSLMNESGVDVEVDTLDHVLSESGVRAVSFIKIDVEGMELDVLRGAVETLKRARPVVYFETLSPFRNRRGYDAFAAIQKLFADLDYGLYDMTSSSRLVRVTSDTLPANTLALPIAG